MKSPEKVLAKEQKQLARLRKERNRPSYAAYPLILLVFLILLRMLDEFTTNCSGFLQSSIVNEFFVIGQGKTFQEGLSAYGLATSSLTLLVVLATFAGVLSDKIGRKPILLASGAGIAIGALTIFFAPSFGTYMAGSCIMSFFIAMDMHQLYLVEVAPENKRATWQAYSSFFAQMAVVLIGVLRLLNTGNGQLAWRNIYLIPAVACIIVVVMLLAVVRETDVFLKQRIAYLETPIEERKAAGTKKNQNGGMGKALRYIFKNKQMLWVMLSVMLSRFALPAFASYNESIMSTNQMSTNAISIALIFSPITMGVVSLIAGFLSDKLGRKQTTVIYSVATIVGLIGFIASVRLGLSPILVGIFAGMDTGCYWAVGGQLGLMMQESAPTALRGSIGAAAGLLQTIAATVASVFAAIMVGIIDLSLFCIVSGVVILGAVIVSLLFKVSETKGVDLSAKDVY